MGALALANPIMAASGTFGYGLDLSSSARRSGWGRSSPRVCRPGRGVGNPTPRIVETAAGMINAIGLQNIGVEAFCRDALPVLRERGAVVAVNVFGERMEEYVEVIERCEREEGIAAYELNVSCPNVTAGGMEFGHDPAQLERLTRMCRDATRRQLWVKLSPNAPDLVATARAAVAGGADALTLINTLRAMAIDAVARRPVLASACGGLSGPAIKPIALRMVWEVHRALPEVPLVGIGGVETGRDVVEFLLAGASAVQVGTAIFRDPAAPLRILSELERFCAEHGVADVARAGGGARSGPDACTRRCAAAGGGARHLRAGRRSCAWRALLRGRVGVVKVGLEAFTAHGPALVARGRCARRAGVPGPQAPRHPQHRGARGAQRGTPRRRDAHGARLRGRGDAARRGGGRRRRGEPAGGAGGHGSDEPGRCGARRASGSRAAPPDGWRRGRGSRSACGCAGVVCSPREAAGCEPRSARGSCW